MKHCVRGKVIYRSRKTAWKWAIYYKRVIGTESCAYKCRLCGKFHLTTKHPMQVPKSLLK